MRLSGRGKETYLYLNGLVVETSIRLGDHVELQPASCAPTPDSIIKTSASETDLAVATLFLRSVRAQIHVTANSPKELATIAWNTIWDAVLLSAFFNTEVVCNLQCDTPASEFGPQSHLEVTNYHLRGLSRDDPHKITEEEADWLARNMSYARSLLDQPSFQTSVHRLASFRWHSLPRVRLAILWAGIEGLFGVDSEITFRLSLYIARYLFPDDAAKRLETFNTIKRLYKQRSAAVHGSRIKGDVAISVAKSATILQRLVRQCVEKRALPQTEILAP
jgi:Apea-like HEPN